VVEHVVDEDILSKGYALQFGRNETLVDTCRVEFSDEIQERALLTGVTPGEGREITPEISEAPSRSIR
jgi:hypothetical protein